MTEKWIMKSEDSVSKSFEFLTCSVEEDKDYFFYSYESKLGQCKIVLEKATGHLKLQRSGKEALQLEITVGKKTEMQYQNSFYQAQFMIEGISCEGDLNFLKFSYLLFEQNGEKINEIHIEMKRRI